MSEDVDLERRMHSACWLKTVALKTARLDALRVMKHIEVGLKVDDVPRSSCRRMVLFHGNVCLLATMRMERGAGVVKRVCWRHIVDNVLAKAAPYAW